MLGKGWFRGKDIETRGDEWRRGCGWLLTELGYHVSFLFAMLEIIILI